MEPEGSCPANESPPLTPILRSILILFSYLSQGRQVITSQSFRMKFCIFIDIHIFCNVSTFCAVSRFWKIYNSRFDLEVK
jgi:hypothetical protein